MTSLPQLFIHLPTPPTSPVLAALSKFSLLHRYRLTWHLPLQCFVFYYGIKLKPLLYTIVKYYKIYRPIKLVFLHCFRGNHVQNDAMTKKKHMQANQPRNAK